MLKNARTALISLLLAVAVFWSWRRFSPHERWRAQPYADLPVLVVDYTVPFETYREHTGLFWLLNHNKIRPPGRGQGESTDEPWQLARDYVGYRPTDREHPTRIAHVVRRHTQLIYVTDTYGVYKDDLTNIEAGIAHMDYSPLVFGGLSKGDAHAISDFTHEGGLLVAEFNAFCDPTAPDVRHDMESLFGVDWTEWVGRVFADPYDDKDVPHWLPREYAKQFPGSELPHSPILLLVSTSGQLLVLDGPSIQDVAPRLIVTQAGKRRFPNVEQDAPYFFWFSIMRERPGTKVYARFKLPQLRDSAKLLGRLGLSLTPAALSERSEGKGRALYFAGDFADIDFEPGSYEREGAIPDSAWRIATTTGMTTAPAFWRFYAPVMDQLLREEVAALARRVH